MHFFRFGVKGPQWASASSFTRFLDHTQRRTTVGRTPLDEWSVCRRDLYLTTHNTHNRQISMLSVGLEPTITAGERPQTYALDSAATGTGNRQCILIFNWKWAHCKYIYIYDCLILFCWCMFKQNWCKLFEDDDCSEICRRKIIV